ncbi:aromatic compound dioxygenase [Pleurotus eryngii]|uniref:Aromatic compound dioxygenase n=1 Tax=Pleurotus eryngii TaxID=5323 RepID=A0A9P6DJB8_PLEER|nr:aromatic compound dioxygenase [Pleurotus eryngii]
MAAPSTEQTVNVSNGIPPPSFDLPYPETPETITENLLKLGGTIQNTRHRFLFTKLVEHLHQYIKETSITTEEWMNSIQFLTQVGQTSTPIRQEFILLSDVLGVSALVDLLNTPAIPGATANSVLGPFHTDDAPLIENGESIASEGKGKYLYIEGRVLDTEGNPVPGALIETWQADETGLYDTQYPDRDGPDLRGLLKTDKDGKYGYRAVVPEAYPIPGDGPVGELLVTLNRHNMRPAHIHITVDAPGYRKLTTALYPEGNVYLRSDCVFGVKESLVVKLVEVTDEKETRRRGFPKGNMFKLLTFDIVLVKQ